MESVQSTGLRLDASSRSRVTPRWIRSLTAPADLLNDERIRKKGIDPKYLEAEKGKQVFDVQAVIAVIQLFDGPFGFAYAARLN